MSGVAPWYFRTMGGSRGVQKRRQTSAGSLDRSLDRRLRLYESAVQQPLAEVSFVERAYAHANGPDAWPRTLREDFAGTSSVAAAWCLSDPSREAIAVESHRPTVAWAEEAHASLDTLYLVHIDVMKFRGPRVDVLVALNFSVLIWHERAALATYLKHARRCLADRGVLIMDLFGGPDAMRVQTQERAATDELGRPMVYRWEQRRCDALSARIDCRIHFGLADGSEWRDAFVYDWRLWSPAELIDALREAGFADVQVWAEDRRRPGRYAVVDALPDTPAWVVYLTARR